eukprot:36848-Chlamydomonas_euryale.AAC.1
MRPSPPSCAHALMLRCDNPPPTPAPMRSAAAPNAPAQPGAARQQLRGAVGRMARKAAQPLGCRSLHLAARQRGEAVKRGARLAPPRRCLRRR